MHHNADVLIIGAGLAGLTAGYTLAAQGKRVHILEAKPIVGGRTASWHENGMEVESGLHRFLGFYTELPKLMEAAGIDLKSALIWENEIEIRIPDGGPSAVYGMALFNKPFRSVRGLLGENYMVTPSEKAALAAFHIAGLADYSNDPDELDSITVREYALKHNVSERAIENMLIPFTSGIFFLPPEQYSTLPFFGLLAQGAKRFRSGVAAFAGGMTDVLANPIANAIRARGGVVDTETPVDRLSIEDGRVVGVWTQGTELCAPQTIMATSLKPAQDILRRSGLWKGFESMLALPSMPVITIQMELDAPAVDIDRLTFAPGTVLGAFAEQSRTTFKNVPGRLSVILVPPQHFLDLSSGEIFTNVVTEAERIDIKLKGHVTNYCVTKYPDDFYSLTCGTEKLRPAQLTHIPGLTLAGDYTKQEFFVTMEGAVRSGLIAAEIVIGYTAPFS